MPNMFYSVEWYELLCVILYAVVGFLSKLYSTLFLCIQLKYGVIANSGLMEIEQEALLE